MHNLTTLIKRYVFFSAILGLETVIVKLLEAWYCGYNAGLDQLDQLGEGCSQGEENDMLTIYQAGGCYLPVGGYGHVVG